MRYFGSRRNPSRQHIVRFRYELFKLCQVSLRRTYGAITFRFMGNFLTSTRADTIHCDASLHDSICLTARILSPMLLKQPTTCPNPPPHNYPSVTVPTNTANNQIHSQISLYLLAGKSDGQQRMAEPSCHGQTTMVLRNHHLTNGPLAQRRIMEERRL